MDIEVKVKAVDYLFGTGMVQLANILKSNGIGDVVEVCVEYDYFPEYRGSAEEPPEDEEVVINAIFLDNTEIEYFAESAMMDTIINAILNHINLNKESWMED